MSNFLEKIRAAIALFLRYAPTAVAAVQGVQGVMGPGGGATSLGLATAGVLATVHPGETALPEKVAEVASVVQTVFEVLKATGTLAPPVA